MQDMCGPWSFLNWNALSSPDILYHIFRYPFHGRLSYLFEWTPKLHTLRLPMKGLSDIPFFLPHNQINNLHLANYKQYSSLLDKFPNIATATLQKCRLAFYSPSLIDIPIRKLIVHDTNTNLTRAFDFDTNYPNISKIPHLASLEVICSEPLDPSAYTVDIRSIPDLTHSPLTELILTTIIINYTKALSLLRIVPQLERLSIVERMHSHLITPEFIQELGRPGPEILHALEHLQLVWFGHADEGAIMDMLGGRALKSAVISEWEASPGQIHFLELMF
ncbi:hypothetical protein IW261DRAFT_1517576 [Armillaria novae-zelandiae]|uniref:Uncharacterized protein n=1 Tax=Armillaria novae-zelandiae TaxID=153914 RepID=A0AA39TWS8_9AGAR|nr:hypothetical protein IW261DRAFT_1517576 [Armillaria novae-zelandiae]